MTLRPLVPLAVIVRPHGVRGELRAKLFNPDSELLFELDRVVLRRGDHIEERNVVTSRTGGDEAALFVLEGCTTRDAADALRGTEICVARDTLPALADGEFYLFDLIGLTARTPAGEAVGTVERVLEYPASTCMLVRSALGHREIPLVEPYLVEVAPERGEVIVSGIEDLEIEAPRAPKGK